LFSSGLIAGEAIMGIVIAFIIVGGARLPVTVIGSNLISVIALAAMTGVLALIAVGGAKGRP